MKNESNEKAFCKTHPVGFIGRDSFGHWYNTCWTGKKLKDEGKDPRCNIQIEKEENNG